MIKALLNLIHDERGFIWIPAAIAAAAALGGGAMNMMNAKADRSAVRSREQEARAWQAERDDTAIQRRVSDARKAGIHPLYGLGANVQTSQPVVLDYPQRERMGDSIAEMGQHLGTAVGRMMDGPEKQKHQMDMALGAAQIAESDARKQYYLSEAARTAAASQVGGLGIQTEGVQPLGPELESQAPNPPGMGIINVKAAEQTTTKVGHPYVSAGVNPAFEEREIAPGLPMMLPISEGESPEELLSEMSYASYLGLLLRNAKIYGEGWLSDFMNTRYFGGKSGSGTYKKLADQPRTMDHPPRPAPWQLFPGWSKSRARRLKKAFSAERDYNWKRSHMEGRSH